MDDKRPDSQGPQQQKPRGGIFVFMMFLGLLLVAAWFWAESSGSPVPWTNFLDNVKKGKVAKIKHGTTYIEVEAIKGSKPVKYTVNYPGGRYIDSNAMAVQAAIDKCVANGFMTVLVDGDKVEGALAGFLMNLLFFGFIVKYNLAIGWYFFIILIYKNISFYIFRKMFIS